MNNLKFRIWDNALGLWVEEYVSGTHCFTEVYLTLDGRVEKFAAGFPENGEDPLFSKATNTSYQQGKFWSAKERYEVEQFTGIKDSNERDIYEGDIIRGVDGILREVDYFSDYGGFAARNPWVRNNKNVRLDCDFACECRVVGNIHENSDLLK
jgi:hypothetical protein